MASRIWLEEADEHVWHRLAHRVGPGTWRTVCGWEMSAFRGRVDDCSSCIGALTSGSETAGGPNR